MKKIILSIATSLTCLSLSAQPFTKCSLVRNGANDVLSFSVKSESNVRYYLLEASRDSASYDIVARTAARGNKMLAQQYSLCSYDTNYRYYRVRQVDMMAGIVYSTCLQPAHKKVSPERSGSVAPIITAACIARP